MSHTEPASRSPDFAKSGSPSERHKIGRQHEAVKRGVVRLFLRRLAAIVAANIDYERQEISCKPTTKNRLTNYK